MWGKNHNLMSCVMMFKKARRRIMLQSYNDKITQQKRAQTTNRLTCTDDPLLTCTDDPWTLLIRMAVFKSSFHLLPSFSYSVYACSSFNTCCIKPVLPENCGQFIITFSKPMLLFLDKGSFCWIKARHASRPFEPAVWRTTIKVLCRVNEDNKL